MLSALGLGL